jgi:hypothetical protein
VGAYVKLRNKPTKGSHLSAKRVLLPLLAKSKASVFASSDFAIFIFMLVSRVKRA